MGSRIKEAPDDVPFPPADAVTQPTEPLFVNPQPTEIAPIEPVTTTRSGRQSMPHNQLIVTGYLAIAHTSVPSRRCRSTDMLFTCCNLT
jgi:hypothetical protein